ncbi:MAG TPA: hypothetical protein VJO16_02150, partial [Candidatus Acidoferrum sp.]|nr:hypothetical protein [Candidatus Acidoferrum sp.]
GSSNGYIVNNISFSWNTNNPAYGQYGGSANNAYFSDLMFGAANDFTYSNPSQFLQANPLFLAAPLEALGNFVSSLAPSLLGGDLTLTPLLSPALGQGIDPSTISGLSSSIASDLKKYIYTDINGKARPQGGCDLGAYQH